MSHEEEFDRIMREKAEEANYPFNEAHWQSARTMIDASRRGSSRDLIPMVAGLAVVCGLTVWYLSDSVQKTPVVEKMQSHSENVSAKEQAGPEDWGAALAQSDEVPKAVGSSKVSSNKKTSVSHSASENKTSQKSTASRNAVEKPLSGFSAPAKPAERPASPEAPTNDVNQKLQPDQPLSLAEVSGLGVSDKSSLEIDDKTNAVAENDQTLQEQSIETLQPRTAGLFYVPSDPDPKIAPLVLFPAKPQEDYVRTAKAHPYYFAISGGAAWNRGWNEATGTDGKGPSWYAGAEGGLFLGTKFFAALGLQWYSLNNLSQPFYTAVKSQYGFSSVTQSVEITANKLLYASVPVWLGYQINTNNRVMVGVNAGLLVQAQNQVAEYSEQDNAITKGPVTTNNKIYECMNSQSWMLTAAYRLRLQKRFWMQGEVYYGLTDIFTGTTASGGNQKPSGFRLGLVYTLVEK